jgi:pimeloyl-ACP methyl ester carboxylesterase
MPGLARATSAIAMTTTLVSPPVPVTLTGQQAPAHVHCERAWLPVRLSPADPATHHIAGWLCSDGSPGGRTVQLLVHGITYGAYYWDFPVDPERYSYVRAAAEAGYATFTIDRLGAGSSDYPPAAGLDLQSEAYTLHQVITALRAGRIGDTRFTKVIVAAHSYGSYIAIQEAAAYSDVSGLILTGWLSATNQAGRLRLRQDMHPAGQDPKFAGDNLPSGYFTTMPGTRGANFYNASHADPRVIAADEALKQTASSGDLASVRVPVPVAMMQRIRVPVLLAVGQDDALDCNAALPGLSCANSAAILARERASYAEQACLQAFVLPGSGHSVNLAPGAPLWFAAASRWADRHVGHSAPSRADRSCESRDG